MQKHTHFTQRIRLRHLRTFVTVARHKTLGDAAQMLNLSQPALSKTLNELEQLTDTNLLTRGRSGTALTPEGEQFLVHATHVLDALNKARQSLADNGYPSSVHLRIGLLTGAAEEILSQALPVFHQQLSHATVHIVNVTPGVLLKRLKSGELDIGIGKLPDHEQLTGFRYEQLISDALKVVVSPCHPLLRQEITCKQVISWPTIIPHSGTSLHRIANDFICSTSGNSSSGQIATSSASLARKLTLQHHYVWFTPASEVNADLHQGTLTELPLSLTGRNEPTGMLTYVDTPLSANVQLFQSLLRNSALTSGG